MGALPIATQAPRALPLPLNLIPQRVADTHVMQEFLKSKGEPVSGKKADLVERVSDWLQNHP